MSELERTHNQQEKERLNRLAEKMEQLATPREISISNLVYMEQLHKAVDQLNAALDEVAALKEKLNAIQSIINPNQTQESE